MKNSEKRYGVSWKKMPGTGTSFKLKLDTAWLEPPEILEADTHSYPAVVVSPPKKKWYFKWKWPFFYRGWEYPIDMTYKEKMDLEWEAAKQFNEEDNER